MVNKIMLVGRLGKDADNREVGEKTAQRLSVATTESYKKDGEWVENTEWHSVVFWSKTAKELKQGDLVFVEGKMTYPTWIKDGNKKYGVEVKANYVRVIQKSEKSEMPTNPF